MAADSLSKALAALANPNIADFVATQNAVTFIKQYQADAAATASRCNGQIAELQTQLASSQATVLSLKNELNLYAEQLANLKKTT